MSTKERIPSFNDFSPGLLNNDLRPILKIIAEHPKDELTIFSKWQKYLGWTDSKRIKTNIPASLSSTGLIEHRPLNLSEFGISVQKASTSINAAQIFCSKIINQNNGEKLIEAIYNLTKRGDRVTKETLQAELKLLGINLSNNTTDHTTLKNWMIVAGIISEDKLGYPIINDSILKSLTGISNEESNAFHSLSLGQQIFLQLVRESHATDNGPFNIEKIYTRCREIAPHEFKSANLAKAVKDPLVKLDWIKVTGNESSGRGGKSGWVSATQKLLSVPLQKIIPDFDSTVPSDLRQKLQTPLSQIKEWLFSQDTHLGGLGLELLALRIILDLRLKPRNFRQRSKDTAFAEIDLTAEGDHLMFSRWTFQCKRIEATKNVSLGDVAKEVGLAIYMKAHVIVMVSTGGFSSEALAYAKEITKATHLQFVFLNGKIITEYLNKGASTLHEFFMLNAKSVMSEKRSQSN